MQVSDELTSRCYLQETILYQSLIIIHKIDHQRMSNNADIGPNHITNDAIWSHTRSIFLVAALFFLVNISLGFDNALASGPIPRWQILTHLHAAALGWITLSVIGLAIWLFTGDRSVSDRYVRGVRLLGWLSILAFVAYVASIAIAFSQGGENLILLPIFGTAALVMFWVAALFALTQLRSQSVVTTVHLLIATGLLVAAIGATMGVLIGLNYATGVGIATIQAHAPPMLFYSFLFSSAIVEWVVRSDSTESWSRAGLTQAIVLFVGAIVPPIAFLFDLEALAPLLLVMLILFVLIFLVRVGWRALYSNPLRGGLDGWVFFGTLWLVVVVVLFPLELVLQPHPPEWLLPVLTHVVFIGMITNLLFGVLAVRTGDATTLHPWAESITMWLINLGLVVFSALKIAMDTRLGALVMGFGVLLGAGLMLYRLW